MDNAVRVKCKAVWGSSVLAAAIAALALLATSGCGKATEGHSPAYLVVDELVAASGAEPDKFSNTLISDVLTVVNGTPTVFQDNGRVTLHVALKDIGGPGSPNTPSANNRIVVERYHVTYIRADGRNTPGVDVPYGFDGMVTGTISESSSQLIFPMVRAAAKAEAPLAALIGGGGAQHISCFAQITFYGHDIAGNAVSVQGQMTVDFADWGDPA